MKPTHKNTRDNCVRHALSTGACPLCKSSLIVASVGIVCEGCGFCASREELDRHGKVLSEAPPLDDAQRDKDDQVRVKGLLLAIYDAVKERLIDCMVIVLHYLIRVAGGRT